MNAADVSKLMSQLRVAINPRHRNMRNIQGPEGRLLKLRKTVTALIKYERVELFQQRAHETQGYAERLISDAIRYGDCNKAMMEMADYWIIEKQLIHKLFKVLVPRYKKYNTSFTSIYSAPRVYPTIPGHKTYNERAILELKENPFPSLIMKNNSRNKDLLHNVLLDAAKRDFYSEKLSSDVSEKEAEEKLIKPVEHTDDIIEINEKK